MRSITLLLSFFLFTFLVAFAQEKPEAAAQKATTSWLTLVDKESYTDSWQQAATLFKQQVTADQWKDAVVAARGPLGKLSGRTLSSAQHTTSLPNAPAGDYVILQYQSSFEKYDKATETIIMVLETDKKWHTLGYFVK